MSLRPVSPFFSSRRGLSLGAALVAFVFAACGGSDAPSSSETPTDAVPSIVRFDVAPTKVRRGELVTIVWETRAATSIQLDDSRSGPIPSAANRANGSVQVRVSTDTLFTLHARNEAGRGNSNAVAVTVLPEGSGTARFTATPSHVLPGQTSTLTWVADGARDVRLAVQGGEPLAIESALAGSLTVKPERSTTYELNVDGQSFFQTVYVAPSILSFTSSQPQVAPGESFDLRWLTRGASRVELQTAAGEVLQVLSDGSGVAEGSHTFPAPMTVAPSTTYSFVLVAFGGEGGLAEARASVSVPVVLAPVIRSLVVPRYVASGSNFRVSWETKASVEVSVFVGDSLACKSSDLPTAILGDCSLPAPQGEQELRVVATNASGQTTEQRSLIEGVGLPATESFSVSPNAAVQKGGEARTLSWKVANARYIRVQEEGGRNVIELRGRAAAEGSVVVHPNNTTVRYTLFVSNEAGGFLNSIPTVAVTVAEPLAPTLMPAPVPVGATVDVTLPGNPGVRFHGLTTMEKNRAGAEFIDIRDTGKPVVFTNADHSNSTITLDRHFRAPLYGSMVNADVVTVSTNGWFCFGPSGVAGMADNTPLPIASLPALVVAPFYDNLVVQPDSKVVWADLGDSPNRRFILQWTDVRHGDDLNNRITFQAQVDERGEVTFAYQRIDKPEGVSPTVGLQSAERILARTIPTVAAGETYSLFTPATDTGPLEVTTRAHMFAATLPDGGSLSLAARATIRPKGAITVSEVNARPAVPGGQWIELYNPTDTDFPLEGWTVAYGNHEATLSGPGVVPAMGYALLAGSDDAGEGLPVAAVLPSDFSMVETNEPQSLLFSYRGGLYLEWPFEPINVPETPGISLQRDLPPRDGFIFHSGDRTYCPALATYGSHGQRGTPGAPNRSCLPYTFAPIASGYRSLETSGIALARGIDGPEGTDEAVYPLTLPFAVRYGGDQSRTLQVSTNGWVSLNAISLPMPTNRTLATRGEAAGVIAPFWDDLQGNQEPGAGLFYEIADPDGVPDSGDERVRISWEDVTLYSHSGTSLNLQVELTAEGTIDFHYGAMMCTPNPSAAKGYGASIWLEERRGDSILPVGINKTTVEPNTSLRFTLAP